MIKDLEKTTITRLKRTVNLIFPMIGIFALSSFLSCKKESPENKKPDITPPVISITTPANNANLSGLIQISASASDEKGLTSVQFKLDNADLGTKITVSPYNISWNTTTASNGNHTITAVACDAAGNSTTSAAVNVIINNVVEDTQIYVPENELFNYGAISSVVVGANREFIVNGKPFFPIMTWLQAPSKYSLHKFIGINTHVGSTSNPVTASAFQAFTVPGFSTSVSENGNILAWVYDDEPDMPSGSGANAVPKQSPQQVATKAAEIKAAVPGRLLFMTFTGHFTPEVSTYLPDYRETLYAQYIANADVVGFDIYPIYGSGYPSRLNWVSRGVSKLKQLAPAKPLYAWIETCKGSKWMTYEKQPDVLPIHTRNEVWQAIIHGATAIGYFTHAWQPVFNDFAITEDMKKELARLNNQITKLAPAILAPASSVNITMNLGDNLLCSFKATDYNGYIFVFALNMDLGPGAAQAKQFDPIYPRSGIATFTMSGLNAQSEIKVIGENRTIIAQDGKFTDEFGPLAEHLYRIKL